MKNGLMFLPVWLFAMSTFAQHPQPSLYDGPQTPGQIAEELEFPEEKAAQLKIIHEKYLAEKVAVRHDDGLDREERRAIMGDLAIAQREEMKEVLSPGQWKALWARMEEGRREMRRMRDKLRADRKALRREVRTYREQHILPVMTLQRAKLEEKISDADKMAIADLRTYFESVRQRKAEARHDPEKRSASHEFLKSQQGKRDQVKALLKKHRADIDALMAEISPQREQWKKDLLLMAEQYRPAYLPYQDNGEHRGKGKGRHHPQPKGGMSRLHFLLLEPAVEANTERAGPVPSVEVQVYPNPARDFNTLSCTVIHPGEVRIELRDKEGRLLRILLDDHRDKGAFTLDVDLSQLRDGLYYYTIVEQNGKWTKKLVVSKD